MNPPDLTPKITQRQSDVLRLVQKGATNKQVANRLGLSEAMVKQYVSALLKVFCVRTRVELALFSLRGKSPQLPEGLEAVPFGWIKLCAGNVTGFVIGRTRPSQEWVAVYTKGGRK